MTPSRRAERRAAIRGFRREQLLEAARRVFLARGLDGARMRAIADEAGCAVGTLYLHFADKEAVYAAILEESLDELAARVQAAGSGLAEPRQRAMAVLKSMFDYYAEHPDTLDLGLYLFGGARRRGLGAETDRRLNARLGITLEAMIEGLRAFAPALTREEARVAVAGTIATSVGALILEGTGRLGLLSVKATELVQQHVETTLDAAARGRHAGQTRQNAGTSST